MFLTSYPQIQIYEQNKKDRYSIHMRVRRHNRDLRIRKTKKLF